MATTKPRITITLTQRQYEVLKSISDTSGQPMSTFVTELLELTMPTVERMAVSFQKIKAAQDVQKRRILDQLDEAQSAIEPVVQDVVGQFDLFMTRIEEAAGVAATDARERAGADTPAAAPAPITNRGATGKKGKAGKAGQQGVSSDSKRRTSSKKGGMAAA